MNEEEARTFISATVDAILARKLRSYAAILGIANVLAFVGFAVAAWQATTQTVRETVRSTAISFAESELKDFRLVTDGAIKRIDKLNADFDTLNQQAGRATADVRNISEIRERVSAELAVLSNRATEMALQFSQLAQLQPAKLAVALQQIGDPDKVRLLESFGGLKTRLDELQQQLEKLPLPKYDSGWIKVEKAQSYPLTHNLGRLPRQVMCFAAGSASGANMIVMDSVYSSGGYGAWVQDITQSDFVLSTGINYPVSGYGKDDHFRWSRNATFIKVLMW